MEHKKLARFKTNHENGVDFSLYRKKIGHVYCFGSASFGRLHEVEEEVFIISRDWIYCLDCHKRLNGFEDYLRVICWMKNNPLELLETE